jgi:hypothetical protein
MTVEMPMLRRLVEGETNSLHLGVAAGSENHLRKIHVQIDYFAVDHNGR